MEERKYEFGLDSFMAVTAGADGEPISGDLVVRNTVEEGVLAEQVGIDSFNIGEHYRDDMMDAAGHVVLATIAGRTERIRLGTAVTVLSTQDPVRLYGNFATLDAVSGGRAQLIVGRGSAIESFPLFGYDLREYEEIFEEKLELFVQLLRGGPITWSGKYRPPLNDAVLTPPLPPGHLPTWVGSGGSPDSVIRAARHGLPLMLAVIGRTARAVSVHLSTCIAEPWPSTGTRPTFLSGSTRLATWPAPTTRPSRPSGRIGFRRSIAPRASAVGARRHGRSSTPR